MKVLKREYFDKNDFSTALMLKENNPPLFSDDNIDEYLSIFSEIFGESDIIPGERLTHDFSYAFPRGWQVNLEAEFHTSNYGFRLVTQSDKGGGSFADVKMETLRKYKVAATGVDPLSTIQTLARNYLGNCNDFLPLTDRATDFVVDTQTCLEIIQMSDPKANLLQRKHHEFLRDYLNYTNFLGGIQVPIVEGPGHEATIIGWLRISVSGADEWQDLTLAIAIAELAADMLEFYIDFDELSATLPAARFLIDLRANH